MILSGDFYTGAVLASTLTKLVLRYTQVAQDARQSHALRAEVRDFVQIYHPALIFIHA